MTGNNEQETGVEETGEGEAVTLEGFAAVAASVFAQTGQVPAAMLLMEVADRLPVGHAVKAAIEAVLREANEGVQVVMEKVKEQQESRIQVVGADALPASQ